MSRTSQSGLAAQKTPAPVATSAKSHFDTFETKFFEQGEAGHGADGERMEEWEEPSRTGRMTASRPFLLGVTVGSLSVALLGGVGLWLTGVRLGGQASTSAPAAPAAVIAAAEPVLTPAPAAPVPSAAPPAPSSSAAQPSAPAPTLAPPPPAVAAESEPSAATVPVAAPPAPADPAVVEKAAPVAAPAEEPTPGAAAEVAPAPAEPAADDAVTSCKQAIVRKRSKEVLAVCPAAFTSDPSAADIAVALAKAEFNRGRGAHAVEWGRKAIALDENLAEAYVFVGGGEQMAGHDKAAKAAYRRYLELAPKGQYAADVRAILGR